MSTSANSLRPLSDSLLRVLPGSLNHRLHLQVLTTGLLFLVGQLLTKTNIEFALCSTCAVLLGLYSVVAAGGLTRAAGFLNATITVKFLLIALLLKIFTLQPAHSHLGAPRETGLVMALGFLGLLIGTWIHRRLPAPSWSLIPEVGGARMYLALTIVFFVCSYVGYYIGISPELAGDGVQTGGILGIARNISLFKSLPVVSALYFAWASGSKRFMTHPLVLTILVISTIFGFLSTNKQDAMEPLLFYVAVSASRYGIGDKRLWMLGVAGVAYYSLIIYPYSQYVRHYGGRQGDMLTRVKAMGDVLWWQLTDPSFRAMTQNQTETKGDFYLGIRSLEPYSRLAMMGEADRLIAATNEKSTTGWETISWGFRLVAPSFLSPNKPIVPAGNYLGHITGDASPDDELSQFSYGVMANFYNAFSFPGVFIGSILLFCVFYYSLRVWFGDPRWTPSPQGTTLWFLVLAGFYQHSLIEESFAGIISRMTLPVLAFALYQCAKFVCLLLPGVSLQAGGEQKVGQPDAAATATQAVHTPFHSFAARSEQV